MKTRASTFDEVFSKFADDEEFKKEERKLRPYYDLVIEIINRRKELGLTQKDLADKADTHQARISKIESAEYDIRMSTLIQIAEALDSELSISLTPVGKPIPINSDSKASGLFKMYSETAAAAAQNFSESEAGTLPVNPVYA
jgi:transcriptional regulator with XRE-family HTH domain